MIEEIKVRALALEFSVLLRRDLSENEFKELTLLTKKKPLANACYSHDYLDSNMTMLEAFQNVIGREGSPDNEDDLQLINLAWDFAIKHNFKN